MASETVQLLAAIITAINAGAWLSWSRFERPGHGLELRASIASLPVVRRGGDLVQIAPLVYPVFVVVAPSWAYEGKLHWSSSIDVTLQAIGIGLWALGIAMGLWAARTLGAYGAVSGVAVHHHLVSDGPYRYVRHPIYTAIIAITLGTTLVFQSYLLVGVTALSVYVHLWWAAAEEKLLKSDEGLGGDYRAYESRTGRFLPRIRPVRGRTGPS